MGNVIIISSHAAVWPTWLSPSSGRKNSKINSPNSWLQFALFVGALLLITKPLGLYWVQVLDVNGKN